MAYIASCASRINLLDSGWYLISPQCHHDHGVFWRVSLRGLSPLEPQFLSRIFRWSSDPGLCSWSSLVLSPSEISINKYPHTSDAGASRTGIVKPITPACRRVIFGVWWLPGPQCSREHARGYCMATVYVGIDCACTYNIYMYSLIHFIIYSRWVFLRSCMWEGHIRGFAQSLYYIGNRLSL